MKWFYRDKDGKLKKYVGNVIERDGKYYGVLTSTNVSYEPTQVTFVPNGKVVDKTIETKVWREPNGKKHIYNEAEDGKIINENGKSFIRKFIDSTIKLIYHKGE